MEVIAIRSEELAKMMQRPGIFPQRAMMVLVRQQQVGLKH